MILGTRNIAFMHGPSHKALRKSFLALFTRKALSVYIQQQDAIIREHLELWMENPGAQEMRMFVWKMNAATSQRVFVGEWEGDRWLGCARVWRMCPGNLKCVGTTRMCPGDLKCVQMTRVCPGDLSVSK
jgi:hypothetical protein